MINMKELNKELDRTKIGLISKPNSIFITTILFSLKFAWNDKIPTARVDGIHLQVNPEFFLSLNANQRMFLLAHECWHVCLLHMVRGMGKNEKVYNMAADYVINLLLVQNNFTLIEGVLLDHKYDGFSTEQVYDILMKNPPPPESNSKFMDIDFSGAMGDGGSGKSDDGNTGNDKLDAKGKELEITNIVIKAMNQSRMGGDAPGTIPGDVEILIEELINPKLPWNQIYQNYINAYVKEDYSFRKPNRRFMPDFYLPSVYSEGIDHLAYAVDASYSVLPEEFQAYISEIDSSIDLLKPKKTTIIDFDTIVKNVHELKEGEYAKDITFRGRGGTNINPPLKYFRNHKPTVLVIFTDGEFKPFYEPETIDFPVIWVILGNKSFTAEFGTIIHYDN